MGCQFLLKGIFLTQDELDINLLKVFPDGSPVVQKTRIPSLGQEDPLEKGMVTHFISLAWRIPHS